MTNTARQIDDLKADGEYFEAGKLARQLGHDDNYGCHFGMRSDLERARAEFKLGYYAEDTVAVWPRGYAHEEGTQKFKVPAGTSDAALLREASKRFGALASISSVTRARAPIASVTEEQAAAYRKHDNT